MRWFVLVFLVGCADDPLSATEGALRVTVANAGATADHIEVTATAGAGEERAEEDVSDPETVVELSPLTPGTWEARVLALGGAGEVQRGVWVSDLLVRGGEVTEIRVDLAEGYPPPAELCNGEDDDGDGATDELEDLPLCTECSGGFERAADDDDRCGVVDCDGLDRFELRGDNTASGTSSCVHLDAGDLTTDRCARAGACEAANGDACVVEETTVADSGLCETIEDCEAGEPHVVTVPDGTPCGAERTCHGGVCGDGGPEPGCADGEREGFLDLDVYPGIAGCAGAWDVGGVTRDDLVPICSRGGGDDGAHAEGTGCASADLCAAGWHVCLGKDEVGEHVDTCADAVPAGAPPKSLLFAVVQSSQSNSVCDDGDDLLGDNDVFGCGNLGNSLGADKHCAPLDRLLASTSPDSCGYNEAQPPLGPWQCLGADDSHLHEGALVTKSGCPSDSCSYDGAPVGSSDKGGVLCCRD